MIFDLSPAQLIRQRHSCRTYQQRPLEKSDLAALERFAEEWKVGPLGNPVRYHIAAASPADSTALKNLGTYGFIKDPTAFLIGAIRERPGVLEDFGYLLEFLVLKAADLNLGTCWLGGTFTKSGFAKRIGLERDETIPAVLSIGYPADRQAFLDRLARSSAGADNRLPWDRLFFEDFWDVPLSREKAGRYAEPLYLVQLGPSASNRQPWRILRSGRLWHFYLQRSPRYPPPVFDFLLGLADLQRIDLGIAMAHFELGAKEAGLHGSWQVSDPLLSPPGRHLEYTVSWVPDGV